MAAIFDGHTMKHSVAVPFDKLRVNFSTVKYYKSVLAFGVQCRYAAVPLRGQLEIIIKVV